MPTTTIFLFPHTLLAVTVAALLVLPRLSPAAVVDYAIEEQGRVIPQKAEISARRVVVREAGGDPDQDLLFDAGKNILLAINHRDRSYLQIDERVINEVAELMDTVSGAVENQQGVLSDLLGTLGIQGEDKGPPPAALRDTGQQLTIAGYACRLYQSHRQGQLESEICVADNGQLSLAEGEFQALRGFLRFGNTMLNKAGPLIEALGLNLPRVDFADTPGLPIGIHSAPRQLKVRVGGIQAGGAADSYQLPAGYTRSAIPFTSG